MDDLKTIGRRIREARKKADLTQMELAVAIDVSRSHLTHVENGKNWLSIEKLALLATETDVKLSWLLGDEGGEIGADKAELDAVFDDLPPPARRTLLLIARTLKDDKSPDPPSSSKRKIAA